MSTTGERARAAASDGFAWVAAAAVDTGDGGRAWTEYGAVDDSLYSGAPGVLVGALEAVTAGVLTPGVRQCLDTAVARCVAVVEQGAGNLVEGDGLFGGWAGIAAALQAWNVAGGSGPARAATDRLVGELARRAATPFANACTDIISGDAGLLVALLTVDPTAATRAAASTVADRLVAAAEESPHGPQWRMVPDYQILMPNFSHGTAGVAYALALAGERLGRPDLTTAAVSGAETLLAVGHTPSGWVLPMSIPSQSHRPLVSFGWCHGPSGTIRLFDLLARLQPGDTRWPQTVAQCYTAARTSGLPERHTPGFWDNIGRCCGTASVGTMVLDRYQATGDPDVLAWADVLAEDVLSRAIETDHGTTWSNHEHTADPPDLTPEAGFMQGTAGIAGWLARLAAVHDDRHAPTVDLGVAAQWV